LDPPLVLNDNDMRIAWTPDVAANTDISTLDDRGLITLVQPNNEETQVRVRNRLKELETANACKGKKSEVVVPTTIEQDSVTKLRDELLGQIAVLVKKVDSQGKEIGQLKSTNTKLETNVNLLEKNVNQLKSTNTKLEKNVNLLEMKADLQEEEIVRVKASNTELKASNTELGATLARHAKIIGSLRRRIVLDDARKKLTDVYPNQATTSQLESGGLTNFATQLHNALTQEDSNLLSLEALQMIFDSSYNTIRSQGNIAAHEAPKSELTFSIFSVDVKGKQRELLSAIYKYAYSEDPVFVGELRE